MSSIPPSPRPEILGSSFSREEKILTVTVPAYNTEKTLARCLDSLVAGEVLSALDIIVVDDGSRDATGTIADEYGRRCPGSFRVIHQENRGHGSGINRAAAIARGKYFKVLDADDVFLTGNLVPFVGALKSARADVVLTHFYSLNRENGRRRFYRTENIRLGREYSFSDFWSRGKGVRASCRFHGICYSTEFYRSLGLRLSEGVFYEDQEYATLPFRNVRTVLPLDLVLYEYTLGDSGQTVSVFNKIKNIGQIERVLWLLWEDFSSGPWMPEAAADYFVHKMTHILFSYYAAALLMNPDRKAGRAQARTLRESVKARAGCLYRASEARYWGTMALHFMGVSWASLMTLHHTPLYRLLFKAAS